MTHYLCEECGSEDGVAFAVADVGIERRFTR